MPSGLETWVSDQLLQHGQGCGDVDAHKTRLNGMGRLGPPHTV